MMAWFGRQFGTVWVRYLAVFALGILVGAAAISRQDSRTERLPCVFCTKTPPVGSGVVCHEECVKAMQAKVVDLECAANMAAMIENSGSAGEQDGSTHGHQSGRGMVRNGRGS